MKNKNTTTALLALGLSILSVTSFAQVKSDTITTIEAYQPFLKDAYKVKNNPTIKDTGKINPNLTYSFLERQVAVDFKLNPIKPAKIKGEPYGRTS